MKIERMTEIETYVVRLSPAEVKECRKQREEKKKERSV